MCVAALAWRAHPRWQLVAIGNRDEFHARPAAPLMRWEEGLLAGRDLEAGGTWLGVAESGRFALVTNYRVEGYPQPGMASRGGLITDWLLDRPQGDLAAMNPFSLLLADRDGLRLLGNHPAPYQQRLDPGLHGLSNGPFEPAWPKTQRLTRAIAVWLDGPGQADALLDALADEGEGQGAAPHENGAPVFIHHPLYGTRCSSVIAIDADGNGQFIERRFDARGERLGDVALTFTWPRV